MRKSIIILFQGVLVVIMTLIVYINISLSIEPDFRVLDGDTVNYSLLCELRALKEAGDNGAAEDMQRFYPEGYLFFYTLYGIACSELAAKVDSNSALYTEMHAGAQGAFDHVNSEQGHRVFPNNLSLPYGAFYTGWSMYLLGKKLLIELPAERDSVEVLLFKTQCQNIARVIRLEAYPPSYNRSSWPADAVLCIAALSLHDRIFGKVYHHDIENWIGRVKNNLDPLKLIPHSIVYGTMQADEPSRGSSQTLMLSFLWEIDQDFAKEQFALYKEHFLTSRVGLPAVLEYPRGTTGLGDIDSGPVIFGVGSSGTIVAQRTMNLFGEFSLADAFRKSIEGFGFPVTYDGQKKYLFGKLPMADAFIAWGHSAAPVQSSEYKSVLWKFHFYSITIVALLAIIWWTLKRNVKR